MSKETKGSDRPLFFCTSCGTESLKWQGRCGACGEWNSMREHTSLSRAGMPGSAKTSYSSGSGSGIDTHAAATPLTDLRRSEHPRIFAGLAECDRVLGGGCVPGSLILISGDPGVGKSTLVLQILKGLAFQGHSILYVSGEESPQQILMRADRLGAVHSKIAIAPVTELGAIFELCEKQKPAFLVIDSIQTIASDEYPSSPGSILQVRECSARLMSFCKQNRITCFIIGQVTKEGQIAGPRLLEHLVDTVLYLEGDSAMGVRLLRSMKNRFGSSGEMGVFMMSERGLEDVANPSALFLGSSRDAPSSGSALSVAVEGTRAIMVEIQVLVGSATYASPRRVVSGMDQSRLAILIAILEKRAGLNFSQNDVFGSVAGGLRVSESAHDLATAAALVSSHRNLVLNSKSCFFGEISLAGAVRSVPHTPARVKEAAKLGVQTIFVPHSSYDSDRRALDDATGNGQQRDPTQTRTSIVPIRHLGDLLDAIQA